ncbi:hypothetical protein CAter282_0849 [Collimonas arenae]|uniref:DUF3613 domain-containing protein n=1 Tax=Collimonas arenae TaxID=279058 RepID=A0A127QF14_9BURK|nr:DUF3613 domain-containing protein [Collimonas arenae]AMP08650.1 hypothetical protein CAter282_0849 [Collimonas arenae]
MQIPLHRYFQLTGCALLATALIPTVFAQDMTSRNGRLTQPVVNATANAPVQEAAQVAGAVPEGPAAAASQAETPTPTPRERESTVRVGDVTRLLLQAQVDGRVAGPRQPMLGVTATASWQRYLDSFKHPLPENFEKKVTSNN